MTITVPQFTYSAYQDTDLQRHDYAKSRQELRETSRQSQTETDRYLSLRQNFGKRVALLEAIETLEVYEEAISDLSCFDDEQSAIHKDALGAMDELLNLIGDTLVLNKVRN